MPSYRVTRSFGGNTRGSTVDLTAKDGKALVDAGYVEETGSSPTRKPRKRAAKKTTASQATETTTEAPSES